MRSEVLGFPVDILSRKETVGQIAEWIRTGTKKPKMVVTAYSEFYVKAKEDKEFGKILSKADLVTPDGVSVLASVQYLKRAKKRNIVGKVAEGLAVGGRILRGEVGETVTGVWLFDELTKMAARKGWKVFLLGGWDKVAIRTAARLSERFPDIRVEYDEGEVRVGTDKVTDKRVVEKINRFKPDLLFVQYNPVKQEKWIASHKDVLKAGVAVGVGGTFNEYLGEFRPVPGWMEKAGLKWLWRVFVEPRRIGRIFRAVFVFPWLVFLESL